MRFQSIRNGVYSGPLLPKAGLFIGHLSAVVAAPVLIIAGLGMTMSVVLLPFGLVFGLSGVLLLVWGLFGHLTTS